MKAPAVGYLPPGASQAILFQPAEGSGLRPDLTIEQQRWASEASVPTETPKLFVSARQQMFEFDPLAPSETTPAKKKGGRKKK